MSIYYTKPSDLLTGTLAKAADINMRMSATDSGFNAVQADTFAAIKLPEAQASSSYLPIAALRAGTLFGFDSAGTPAMLPVATAIGSTPSALATVSYVSAALASAGASAGLASPNPGPSLIPQASSTGTINPLWLGQHGQFTLLNTLGA